MGNKCCSSSKTHSRADVGDEDPLLNEAPVKRDPPPMINMGSPVEQTEEDLTTLERNARHKPHKCTDVTCLVLFLAALGALGYIAYYCSEHSDLRRLYHGFNWHGQLCGVDAPVAQKPYLYWCTAGMGHPLDPANLQAQAIQQSLHAAGASGNASLLKGMNSVLSVSDQLDLQHPICVPSCPTSSDTFHACFQREHVDRSGKDITGTFWENITYNFSFVQDYQSLTLIDRYCVPNDPQLMEQLYSTLQSSADSVLFAFSEVFTAWPVLAASGAFGLILGYIYLIGVRWLAKPIVYASIFLAVVAPLALGLAGLYGAYQSDIHHHAEAFAARMNHTLDVEEQWVPTTGDKTYDVVISASLLVLSFLLCCAACCSKKSIDMVLATIEATCTCMWEMPGLLALPFVNVIMRVFLLAVAFIGLGYVLATGRVEKYDITEHVPGGLSRSFTYTDDEKLMIAGYIFVALWVIETAKAVESFVFSYCTQMWFFNREQVGCLVVPRAHFIAYFYHLGTLAFGGFLLAVLQFAYFVLAAVYSRVREATEGDETTNKVASGIASCCCCCLQCWEKLIRFLNKNTYIVVAISSEDFCTASQSALNVVASEFAAIGLLEGATLVFQVSGVVSITALGTYLSWMLASQYEEFSDPTSEHFVPNPEYVTVAAGVVCLAISWTFMVVFDTISDTILFCWAYEKKYRDEQNMPPWDKLPPKLQEALSDRDSARDPAATQPLMR